MATTIDSLLIEVNSTSTNASSGIDKLSQSLEKLKGISKGGVGLNTVANQLTKVGSAIKGIDTSSLAKIEKLVTALQPLSQMPKQNISSTLTQLKKIPTIFSELNKVDMNAFSSKIQQLSTALAPLANQMAKIGSGFSAFPSKLQKVMNSTGKLAKSNAGLGLSYINIWAKFRMVYNAVKTIGNVIASSIKSTNSYIENINLFTISLGSYANEAKEYAETVGEVMGIDPGEWMRSQGIFMTLAKGFGVVNDRAYTMSKNLTQLGYDISSFYNISIEEAMQKLESGLAGELEPLRRIGYDLSQARLEATALSLGIDKAVSSMTQAEKAELRYYAIMTQITDSHGDMARTLEAPANQLRILKAQVEQAARAFGSIFIPALNAVLPYIIAFVKLTRELASNIAKLVGFKMPEVDYSGIGDMANGADESTEAIEDTTKAVKKLRDYTMGFDELNIIDPSTSDTLGETAKGFEFELPEYDFIGEATNTRVNTIMESIKKLFKPFTDLLNLTKEWAKTVDITPLLTSVKEYVKELGEQWKVLGDTLSWAYEEVILPMLKWVIETALPKLIDVSTELMKLVDSIIKPIVEGLKEIKVVLEPIVEWIGDVVITSIEGIGDIFGDIAETFTEKGDEIKGIITGIGEVVEVVWKILKPILDLVIPALKILFKYISNFVNNVLGGVIDVISGIVNFVAGIFTGDWERAWEGIKEIFSGVWDVLQSQSDAALTAVKDLFEPVAEWFNEKVVQPVVNFFKGLWEKVSGFFKDLWDGIVGIWNTVATWFDENVIQPIVNFFAPIVETISKFFEGCWLIIQAVWKVASTWFNENVIQPIVEFFKGLWEDVSGFFSSLWRDIKAIWKKVSTWFDENVTQPVVGFFKGVWEDVSGFFKSLWEDIKGVWNKVSTWFEDTIITPVKTVFEEACEAIGGFFSSLWLGIRQGVAKAMNGVIGGIESAINWIIRGINKLVGGFNKVVQWAADVLGKDWGGVNLVSEVTFNRLTVPTYATGGFPETGQMFIAREAGAEMVGNIGRKTAVVNNEQIVASVSAGVAEANSEQTALLKEQNALLKALLEKESSVRIDGKDLTKSVEKYQRERGRVLITGGAY